MSCAHMPLGPSEQNQRPGILLNDGRKRAEIRVHRNKREDDGIKGEAAYRNMRREDVLCARGE